MAKKESGGIKEIKKEILKHKNKEKAKILQMFFKTKKGEYGEGDIFLGIAVPKQRQIAKKFLFLKPNELEQLFNSKIHEHRFCALVILIEKYKKGDDKTKEKIFKLYLKNIKKINNWDLVDISAPNIVGERLFLREKDILYKLAKSNNLWEKRIAIISTLYFIRRDCFEDTVRISEILLKDEHNLIHKAVGWMLREMGKKSIMSLKKFLKKHKHEMPRTMLRYSIEKLSQKERGEFLIK